MKTISKLSFASLLVWLSGVSASAQSAGQFVIPGIRAGSGTDFAYWDFFAKPPSQTYNYNYANPPALLDPQGRDADDNPTTAFSPRAVLVQTGSATCFVTSSGALYDFAAPTSFEVRYTAPVTATGEATNVIFQTQTGGTRFDINNIRLVFTRGAETVSLAPAFRALDDPQSGSFSERLVSAFQWDLTGQGAKDFKLVFASPGSSMPVWQAQLDVVNNAPFLQQLGWLLFTSARPLTVHGRPGTVSKNLPAGAEERFFLPGQTLDLTGDASAGWSHAGWLRDGAVSSAPTLPVTFGSSDMRVTALFAPETYEAWRDAMFLHSNPILGQPADNTNDAVSGPEADADGDGVLNFSEYIFGGDPYEPDAGRTTPQATLVTLSGTAYPAVIFRQGISEEFGDALCTVRVSTDLRTWESNDDAPAPVTETVSRVLQPDGTTLVTVRSAVPATAAGQRFFSIKAE